MGRVNAVALIAPDARFTANDAGRRTFVLIERPAQTVRNDRAADPNGGDCRLLRGAIYDERVEEQETADERPEGSHGPPELSHARKYIRSRISLERRKIKAL